MITQKTLLKWRADSLKELSYSSIPEWVDKLGFTKELHERILRLTQELIDLDILRRAYVNK